MKTGNTNMSCVENAVVEIYKNGKQVDDGPWKIDGKEVHFFKTFLSPGRGSALTETQINELEEHCRRAR
ncbi:MAG: hypothetical protein H8E27_08250 [Verrucomicrobia subdivision 3 bacterium]|nr:hypothetical protein [Limisphaerales bacterium]